MKYIILIAVAAFISACAPSSNYNPPVIKRPDVSDQQKIIDHVYSVSTDSTYGYTEENPVKVGGSVGGEKIYLSYLHCQNSVEKDIYRIGSTGGGVNILDAYSIKCGEKESVIYIDMYDFENPYIPMGFDYKK